MADIKLADFIKESSTTTGTGAYDLAGAVAGHQGFVAAGCAGAKVPYVVTDGTDYEVGLGTVTDAATDTLSRDVIYASSNSGSAVSWAAGTRDVYLAEVSGRPTGVRTTASGITLGYTDHTILCNSASAMTIALPAAASYPGKEYTITNINTGKVTIDPNSTEEIRDPTFGASTTFDLWVQYDSVRIISDGSAWWVLCKNLAAHKASLSRNAVQAIPDATLTQVDFDAIQFCIGASYDFAQTYELLINRTGKYIIGCQYGASISSGQYVNTSVVTSTDTLIFNRQMSSAASSNVYSNPCKPIIIASGTRIGLKVRHTAGSSQNTYTDSSTRPELYLSELL